MNEAMWGQRRPSPASPVDSVAVWDGRPCTLADVTELRLHLREGLADAAHRGEADDADIERLLLVFEELTSNGLRHGQTPVRAVVTTTHRGWLIDVSDAATDRPPTLAVGRDAAQGGLGLYLVARLSAAHGWMVQDDRKHVWARIDYASRSAPVPVAPLPRPRDEATGRSQFQ